MRDAAEKKKELEKQHGDAVTELRTLQAQLGLLSNTKNTEAERAQFSQNIESLQVKLHPSFIQSIWKVISFLIPRIVKDQGIGEENGTAEC